MSIRRVALHKENCNENFSVGKTDDDEPERCGVFGCGPPWMQRFASYNIFMLLYGGFGLAENAILSYFSGIISSIEKRYQLPSSVTGMLSSSYYIGMAIGLSIIAYIGGYVHKPRWIAILSAIAGISCIVMYIPEPIFGPGQTQFPNQDKGYKALCNDPNPLTEYCSLNSEGKAATAIFFVAFILIGVGCSSYIILGATYLDDNVSKNSFPFLYALASCLRMCGPATGYLAASLAVSYYINNNINPPYTDDDPQWIGAWYKCWIPLGLLQSSLALAVAFFPKKLQSQSAELTDDTQRSISLKEFKEGMIRLSKNALYWVRSLNLIAFQFGVMGLMTFMPKYIEAQFRQSASTASLVTGIVGLVANLVGFVTSGALLSRYKPSARTLAAYNAFANFIYMGGYIVFIFLGCYKEDLDGSYDSNRRWNLAKSCNSNCNCTSSTPYSPVCATDTGITYYSPCHAGCTTESMINGSKIFSSCSCINTKTAIDGACPIECETPFYIFLSLYCIMQFFQATSDTNNTVLKYRCVEPRDKALSLAIAQLAFTLLAAIPSPIVYGLLLDYTCLVWGDICGFKGNCMVYEAKQMSLALNITSAAFICVAMLADVWTWFKVNTLQIYDDQF